MLALVILWKKIYIHATSDFAEDIRTLVLHRDVH